MIKLDRESLTVRCAYLFHHDKLNIKEIGERLNISRFKVSRYLKQAEEHDFVQIKFNLPGIHYETLAMDMESKFGINRVIIVPGTAEMDSTTVRKIVGHKGTEILKEFDEAVSIGITWGRTIANMVEDLPYGIIHLERISELTGGYGMINPEIHSSSLAPLLAKKTGASCFQMHAPIITSRNDIAQSIMSDKSILRTIDMAKDSDVAIFGVANLNQNSMLRESGILNENDMKKLKDIGVVGSLIGRFMDSEGNEVETEYKDRSIAITWEDFMKIPERIALIGGWDKIDCTNGLLSGGIATTLILDSITASIIMEENQE